MKKLQVVVGASYLVASLILTSAHGRSTAPVEVQNTDASPVPVKVISTPQNGTSGVRFVGISQEALKGNAGYSAMYAACQSTFSPDARMCNRDELLASPELADAQLAPGEAAWVEPGGASMYASPNCNGWSDTGVDSLTYSTSGSLTLTKIPGSEVGRVIYAKASLTLLGTYNRGAPLDDSDFVSLNITGSFYDEEIAEYMPMSINVPGDFDFASISGNLLGGGTSQDLTISFGNGGLLRSRAGDNNAASVMRLIIPELPRQPPFVGGVFSYELLAEVNGQYFSFNLGSNLRAPLAVQTGFALVALESLGDNPRSTSLQPVACNVDHPVTCCSQ